MFTDVTLATPGFHDIYIHQYTQARSESARFVSNVKEWAPEHSDPRRCQHPHLKWLVALTATAQGNILRKASNLFLSERSP